MNDDLYQRELQRIQRRMHEIVSDSKVELWERRACAVVMLERLLMALHPFSRLHSKPLWKRYCHSIGRYGELSRGATQVNRASLNFSLNRAE